MSDPTLSETLAFQALRLHDVWQATPQDRGGANGAKGRALQAFLDAKRAALDAAPAVVMRPTSVEAAAEALYRAGRRLGWWTSLGLTNRDTYKTPDDPISQGEFEDLVSEVLLAGGVAVHDAVALDRVVQTIKNGLSGPLLRDDDLKAAHQQDIENTAGAILAALAPAPGAPVAGGGLRGPAHIQDMILGGLYDHPHKAVPRAVIDAVKMIADDIWLTVLTPKDVALSASVAEAVAKIEDDIIDLKAEHEVTVGPFDPASWSLDVKVTHLQALLAAVLTPKDAAPGVTPAMVEAAWAATDQAMIFEGEETRPGWRILDGEVNMERVLKAALAVDAPELPKGGEVFNRLRQMIVDCEAEPDGPLVLSASVALEHAGDLRSLLGKVMEGSAQPAEAGALSEAAEALLKQVDGYAARYGWGDYGERERLRQTLAATRAQRVEAAK